MIDLHSLYETNILGFLSGAPKRLFANRENRSIDALSNARPRPPMEDKALHKSVYYLDALRPLGITGSASFHLPVPSVELPKALESRLSDSSQMRSVGLFIGAGHPGRKWPQEKFAELARRLSGNGSARIFVILGPEEESLKQEIEQQFAPNTIVVTGLTIREVLVLISKLNSSSVTIPGPPPRFYNWNTDDNGDAE